MISSKKGYIDHLINGLFFVVIFCNLRGGKHQQKVFFKKKIKIFNFQIDILPT